MESEPLTTGERRVRAVGVGCLMTFLGFVSMAMVGVLLSAIVAKVTNAPTCPDIPACNWYIYAFVCGLLGAVSLPVLVLRRMHQPPQAADTQTPKS
jgi:hypothetical protein